MRRGGEMKERVRNRSPRKEQRGAFQVSGPSTSSGAYITSPFAPYPLICCHKAISSRSSSSSAED